MVKGWFLSAAFMGLMGVPLASAHPGNPAVVERSKAMQAIMDVLEGSQKSGKGVQIYVGGQTVVGVVVSITDQVVELKSREFSRIVVRLERIDAVAMS